MLKPMKSSGDFKTIPQGTHAARLYQVIDIGTQETEWQGETKYVPQVMFTFELPNETSTFDGVEKPLVISNRYTLSMGSKAKLRPVIEGLLGVQLRDDEAANFSTEKFKELLGTACMVNVVHNIKGDRTYANIASVVPVPKGMTVPKQFNENVFFEIGTTPIEEMAELPKFIQDSIMKSQEFQNLNNTQTVSKSSITKDESAELDRVRKSFGASHAKKDPINDIINPDDIPF